IPETPRSAARLAALPQGVKRRIGARVAERYSLLLCGMVACVCVFGRVGGAEGNRTPDLLIANEALSQLSYSPGPKTARIMVTAPREVKATFAAGKCRSASNLPARAGPCEGAATSFRRAP